MATLKPFYPVALEYNPLAAGSIDGTDTVPHDHGVVRALHAKYKPNKGVTGDPKCTIFIGRLNHITTEQTLTEFFSHYGTPVKCRLVRDIFTGFSKGYAFVEFASSSLAERVADEANGSEIDDRCIFCDMECERILPGWVPRRLGGGLSGLKESGQLRFGGKDRPFRKPLPIQRLGLASLRPDFEGDTGSSSPAWMNIDDTDRHRNRRSRSRERSTGGNQYKSRGRQGSKDRHRSRSRERHRSKEKQRGSSRDRHRRSSRERQRSRSKERYKGSSKGRYRGSSKERYRGSSKERYRGSSKDRSRRRSTDRSSRERFRSRSKERYRSKEKSSNQSKDRSYHK